MNKNNIYSHNVFLLLYLIIKYAFCALKLHSLIGIELTILTKWSENKQCVINKAANSVQLAFSTSVKFYTKTKPVLIKELAIVLNYFPI